MLNNLCLLSASSRYLKIFKLPPTITESSFNTQSFNAESLNTVFIVLFQETQLAPCYAPFREGTTVKILELYLTQLYLP